ncbi:MAG: hypothetical protein KIS92_06430 [Planctomycetota bacterium]|nr:hypothetical protein [Planctomycetota bacterium]
MPLLRFVLKHLCAFAALAAAMSLACGVLYFALLAFAILFGGGLGGPLALPFMMLSGGLAAVAGCCAAFFPATACAEFFRRRLALPWFCEMPLASVLSLFAALAIAQCFAAGTSTAAFVGHVFAWWLVLAVPLGFYWWTTQAVDALLRVCGFVPRMLARRLVQALTA